MFKKLFITLIIFLCLFKKSNAQSLIAGIPNADVAEKGDVELTHESQAGVFAKPFGWNSFNFICYGIAHNAELTSVLSGVDNENSQDVSLAVGGKKILDLPWLKTFEPKIVVGGNVVYLFPTQEIGTWLYTLASVRLPQIKTRFTFGISYGEEEFLGYKHIKKNGRLVKQPLKLTTFMAGVEQPVYKNISLIADWFQGEHNVGALITAMQIDFKHATFIAGYKKTNKKEEGAYDAIIIEIMVKIATKYHK